MECSFVVGQKVAAKEDFSVGAGIKKGDVFTISKIRSGFFWCTLIGGYVDTSGLKLKEKPNKNERYYFRASLFRPLQDTTKQVEALKRLATDLPWNFDPDPNSRERVDG